MKVRLPKDFKKKITCSKDVYEIIQKVLMRQNKLHRQKEYFWSIGLNTANHILYVELIAIGSLNQVIIDPVEIFSYAIAKKCKRIIVVHNHPSNSLEPSEADMKFTAMLMQGASYIRIKLVDHIIITEKDYLSLADIGVLESEKIKRKI
jgi:DNA repair protein RadC